MAEVKGVIISLSRRTVMPRQLLMEVNSILGPTLDSKNFITMTYAMIDEKNRTMKMSRAGHNPILHYPREWKGGIVQRMHGPGLTKNGIL